MSKFVSPDRERGYVNYDELTKFLAQCIGVNASYANNQFRQATPQAPTFTNTSYDAYNNNYNNTNYNDFNNTNMPINNPISNETSDKYDPDEQAILRLMHENMRDWDQVNLINIDNLRKKFYEVDPYNRYILTMREVNKLLLKNI